MIKGNHVELRAPKREELETMIEWRNDPLLAKLAAGTNAHLWSGLTIEQMESWYGTHYQQANSLEKGRIYSIYHEDRFIGYCDYREYHPLTNSCTVGMVIGDRDYWDRGFGSEAMQLLVEYLHKTIAVRRFQLDTWAGNIRAIKCYEKCGFQIEGTLRDNEWVDGQYEDTVLVGLLMDEHKS